MFKQTLGWTAPKIRDPAAGDRWTWLVIVAHTQLRLARSLTRDLRRPSGTTRPARTADPGAGAAGVSPPPREDPLAGPRTETRTPRSGPPTRLHQPPTAPHHPVGKHVKPDTAESTG
jgi:hypothetical protein